MAVKIFLDANILLDYALNREHYTEAEKVMDLIVNKKARAFITTSVLHITGHWVSKAYGSTKAKKLLISFLADISIIDSPHEIALTALNSRIDDIEDALQYYTAIHHKLDYFISRDKQLQKDSIPVLPVFTPKEFINAFH
ncbi:MAG TPA: PIN domain-containing protein [Mucilaginibacter sp.]|jgi:predicted nucleic acid-binding protein